jgi:putative phosphoesterase
MRHLDELGPEAAAFLSTVDLILHGGDIVTKSVLDWCGQFAPVIAARGNHDVFDDERLAEVQMLELKGWKIGMVHDLRPRHATVEELSHLHFGGEHVDVMIGGDTHVERLEHHDGVIIVNSGSPNLPHHKETRWGTVGLLELEPGRLRAEIIPLGETPGSRNPGTHHHLEIVERRLVSASRGGVAIEVDTTR